MSKIFKLDWKDLTRGAIVAVLTIIFTLPLEQVAEFIPILQNPFVALPVSALFAYLAKNLMTDDSGKLGGMLQIK